MARTKALTAKQRTIQARNRANAQKSTGPKTAEGKARSALNALTHGLRAVSPRDRRDLADRDARAAVLARLFEPEDEVEMALVDRLAAALQRLEKCDHLEAEAFDHAFRADQRLDGHVLLDDMRCRGAFALLIRYRASAAHDFRTTLALLKAAGAEKHERTQKSEKACADNGLPEGIPPRSAPAEAAGAAGGERPTAGSAAAGEGPSAPHFGGLPSRPPAN